MRRYQPLTNPNGRVLRSTNQTTNPYYGQRGADWIKDTNASLFNAQHEHSQTKLHLERQVNQITHRILKIILAILAMLVGGFILFSLAINF